MSRADDSDIEGFVVIEPKIMGWPDPPVAECPISFLGYAGGRVMFMMPEGAIRDERAVEIERMLQIDIYNSRSAQSFLQYWRDNDGKLMLKAAAEWFVKQCRAAGVYDDTRPLRGPGVWPGEDQSVIWHGGDVIWVYPPDRNASVLKLSLAQAQRTLQGPPFMIRSRQPRPDEPADSQQGCWVRRQLEAWNFGPIGDEGMTGADVVVGWIGAALLGAAAPFRPHIFLIGANGTGKTTLLEFIQACLFANTGDLVDSFTKAGLANALAGMARPLCVDEAEDKSNPIGPGLIEELLELLRRMSTGSGAVRKMGAPGGRSVTQTAIGAACLAAISPPRLNAQDASRFVEVSLARLGRASERGPGGLSSDADLERAKAIAKAMSPALLGRALTGASRYLEDVARLKAASRRAGAAVRTADLIAALAAGRRLLMFDLPLSGDEADAEVRLWAPLIVSHDDRDGVQNVGEDCLQHLLHASSGRMSDGRLVSLGELVTSLATSDRADLQYEKDDKLLRQFGLRVCEALGPGGDMQPFLLVANKAAALTRVFQGTDWRNYPKALTYLDNLGPAYKTHTGDSVRFVTGLQSRCRWIPLKPWLVRNE